MALEILKLSLALVLFNSSSQSSAQKVLAFDHNSVGGAFASINISTCSNLPSNVNGLVSSIRTLGNCVRLYDDYSCNGNAIEILPRSPSHYNLSAWKFDNMARSIGPCPRSCPLLISVEEVRVALFSKLDFKGAYLDIKVKDCTPIPTEFHNQTLSVQTNGECAQLYKTEECISGPGVDTIELRPETPYHNDISSAWRFPVAKALSRCDYKCRNISFVLPKEGDVLLFKNKIYTGDQLNISTLGGKCTEFQFQWEGLAESIILGVKTCVILFDRRSCEGESVNISKSIPDLKSVNFDARIRSMKNCRQEVPVSTFTTSTTQIPTKYTPSISSNITTEIPITFGNKTGYTKYIHFPPADMSNFSPLFLAVLVVVPLAVVILSIVVFCTVKHCNPYKKEGSKLSEKEIREFLSGMGIDLLTTGGGNSGNENDYSIEFLAQNNAYNMEYEIARSRIELDCGALLGSGEFGMVYKGKLVVENENENTPSTSTRLPTATTTVAIKTVNPSSGAHGIRSLLKEVKVMLYMGQHTNIAKLIGCCTDKIREGNIMVVMEYCSEGSLESYLKKNRLSYNNLVKKGKLDVDYKSSADLTETENSTFNTFLITQWCQEIAQGMEFLSEAKVVHSDLAARNILLNDQLEAKISDFGLSRQLYAYSQYMKKHQEPLPFRWMALESLKCLEFSTKSDVWSYGVLIWEIFSLGEKPYPGLGWNEAFISNLEGGLRLAKPKNSTNEFYNLMLRCWDENPVGRPSFTEIVEEIQEMKAGFSSEAYTIL